MTADRDTAWPPGAGACLTIDLDAVAANWRLIADRVRPAIATAVVKADGYGLGAVPVADRLRREGCRTFFVAHLQEGVALREGLAALPGPTVEIAVLNGLMPECETIFAGHDLIPVLNDLGEVARWGAFCRSRNATLPAMLHIDSGMNRLGMRADEVADAVADGRLPVTGWRAVLSHLASADTPAVPQNSQQREIFSAATKHFPGTPISLSASSGTFLSADFYSDFVRPGAALYGVNPVPGMPNPMRQTVRLDARILQVRRVDSSETVGYGATHSVVGSGRVATIGVGYADGYPRSASARGAVYFGDVAAPIIGRVSMDLITIDVSAIPEAQAHAGAIVEVIGPHRPVDEVADDAHTIGYEVLTSLGKRYHRRYLGRSSVQSTTATVAL